MLVVTAVVLSDETVGTMPETELENVQAGAVGNADPKVIVQAVAAVMPVICPLLSADPVASVPLPQDEMVGAVLLKAG